MSALQRVRVFRVSTNVLLTGLIVVLLGGMAILAVAQIVMRSLFSFSLYWGDELLQLMVLWLAMTGAVAAARNGDHLRITLLTPYCPRRIRPWMYAVLNAFSAAVCGLLTWQGIRLVFDSAAWGDTILVDIPAWAGQVIIPAGFALLTFHYGGLFYKDVYHGVRRGGR